ncbi:MAG: hypothetical protein WAX69_26200 [Victivallales bacterium]
MMFSLNSSEGDGPEAELEFPAGGHRPASSAATAAGPRTATRGYSKIQYIKFPLKTVFGLYLTSFEGNFNRHIDFFRIMHSFIKVTINKI